MTDYEDDLQQLPVTHRKPEAESIRRLRDAILALREETRKEIEELRHEITQLWLGGRR